MWDDLFQTNLSHLMNTPLYFSLGWIMTASPIMVITLG